MKKIIRTVLILLSLLIVLMSIPFGVLAGEESSSESNEYNMDEMMPAISLLDNMDSGGSPYVSSVSLSKSQVKITFSRYMKPSTVSGIVLRDSSGVSVGYTLNYSTDEKDSEGDVIAKEFTFILKNESEIFAISVPSSIKSFDNISVTTGMNLKGVIKSYDPKKETTVTLFKNGEVYAVSVIEATPDGIDDVTQKFVFAGVPAGKYDLVVSKAGHVPYKITNIIVKDKDVDLSQYERDYTTMRMIAGDMDGDNRVNSTDWSYLWNDSNYLKTTEKAENKLCDINGDGKINSTDWSILWNDVNYLKGESDSTFEYIPPTSYETEFDPFF